MKTFERILVPTDFSGKASEAYPFAQKIAEKFDARIDFIHIIPMTQYFSESIKKLGVPFDMEEDLFPHVIERARDQIQEIMSEHIEEDYRGDSYVQIHRKPSEAISDYARQHKYDLILMGAKGEHESDLLRGSVTEKVIRHSRVPVLSIEGTWPQQGIQHILMPTDTSDMSYASLPYVASLAHFFGADITLLNVIELYGSLSESIPHDPGESEMEAIYENIINHAKSYFEDNGYDNIKIKRGDKTYEDELVINNDQSETIPLHTRIHKGVSAHYGIEEVATENDIDLLVMSTHGRTGLAHIFLGSTTENVAKYVHRPVLTIRPPKESFES